MVSPINIELWQPNSESQASDITMLGELLLDCVNAGAAVSFILPFSLSEAIAFWRDKVLPSVESGVMQIDL